MLFEMDAKLLIRKSIAKIRLALSYLAFTIAAFSCSSNFFSGFPKVITTLNLVVRKVKT